MCDHDAQHPFSMHFTKKQFDDPSAQTGSRRLRLWQLPVDCHCPIIGVCLPIALLRKSVDKALGGKAMGDDYELHVGAVRECSSRNRISDLLQDELERRHAIVIRQFKVVKTSEAVFIKWRHAVTRGDISGALWAALTHPQCDPPLREQICREIHMIQHQAGARVQADLGTMEALLNENAVLTRELAKIQERTTRLLREKSDEIEARNSDLIKLRAELIAKDSGLDFLQSALDNTRAMVPDIDARERLTEKVSRLQIRVTEQEGRIAALRQQLAVKNTADTAQTTAKDNQSEVSSSDTQTASINLTKMTILCVGGRNASIPKYRSIIEEYGGEYIHHDGGLEENMGRLVTSIAAADLVICQTGCVSHDAYWRVKDQCKRSGKQCIYVENPSPSSLTRTLLQTFRQIPVVLVSDATPEI